MNPILALAGGPPTTDRSPPPWPQRDTQTRQALVSAHDNRSWWQDGSSPAELLEDWLRETYRRPALAVGSGTAGLELAVRTLGLGPGDEVLVPATTFIATATAVTRAGAVPVPVDIDRASLTIDIGDAEAALTPATRAIVAVHLAGQPADLTSVAALAQQHRLLVIEDSAQAVGASWDGKRVATVGDAAVLSFQAAKLLPGGEGGALLLRDAHHGREAAVEANNGRPRGSGTYDHAVVGTHARITVWAAALVLAHTDGYERLWLARTHGHTRLGELLAAANLEHMLMPAHPAVTRHDHYAVLLRLPDTLTTAGVGATAFAAALAAEGIPAKPIFPPWQQTPAYQQSAGRLRDTPEAVFAARSVVTLPHQMLLEPAACADVAAALGKITREGVPELLAWQKCRLAEVAS